MRLSQTVRTLNALMAIILMGIVTGAYYQQYVRHETPCPLCLLQRLAMIGASVGVLMNLRFGIRMRYTAFTLLSALFGGVVAGRQICLHICPGFPVFGYPVFGLSLYTWSFIAFFCTVVGVMILLFLYMPDQSIKQSLNWFEKFAFFMVLLLTFANVITTLIECGLGPCVDLPWPQPTS